MLERIQYINHLNETIDIGINGIYVNESDLRDFAWSVTSKNDRITSFKKGVVKKTIPLVIVCTSETDGIEKRNQIFEVCEKDVLMMQYGRFIIGDYYLKCYVTGSKKSDYLRSKGLMVVKLTVQTDCPEWVKETSATFNYGVQGVTGANLDFNNDFAMDYASNLLGQQLINTGFMPADFIIKIYGSCTTPKITIAGHDYEVLTEVKSGEILTINSIDKTVILTDAEGNTANYFNLRNKDSYIFKKIPSGINKVATDLKFKFDIVLLEGRSEPKWT